jgi:hypothetical protein
MENLLTNSLKLTYWITEKVVFEITSPSERMDSCALPCGEGKTVAEESGSTKLPYIVYTDKTGTSPKDVGYWLQILITDGDEFNNGKFKKLNHELATEAKQTYIEYYKFLCEKEIKKVLLANPLEKIGTTVPDSLISQIKNAIPAWMIKDSTKYVLKSTNEGLTAEQLAAIQIDIKDKTYMSNLMKAALREFAVDTLNNALKPYGKKIGSSCITDACILDR